MSRLITLTTDLGIKDHYVASLKGYLYKNCSNINIVDISHSVNAFNIAEAAFIMKNCIFDFPEGSIHIAGVESDLDPTNEVLLAVIKDQIILTKNNGMISLILDEAPDQTYIINEINESALLFPIRDVMAKTACRIVNGEEIDKLGEAVKKYKQLTNLQPIIQSDLIRGTVIHVDNFGNVITNIRPVHFERFNGKKDYSIFYSRNNFIDNIHTHYSQVEEGERLCLFGNSGLLEIAINRGNASQLLDIQRGHIILIEFNDH